CQPCWDQLKDIEKNWGEFQALGIDRIVSITTDPLDALKQKVAIERLSTPLLSDPGVGVSKTYEANKYGMMGNSMNGHSFIVVDKEGVVAWRRDYGAAPKYTMYVPVQNLLADLRVGRAGGTQ
ncbi:MAG: redoxin domain-containing protein, partial [Haloechinothrix sp.]